MNHRAATLRGFCAVLLAGSGCVAYPNYAYQSPGADYYMQMYEQLGPDEYMRRFGPRIAELQARLAATESYPRYSSSLVGNEGGYRSAGIPTVAFAPSVRNYPQANATAIRFGNALFRSDGTSTIRSGNTFFNSDGSSTIKSGNSYFHSNGTSTIKSGNSYFHSDGSSTTRVGNTFINSDGSSTTVLGR